MVGKGYKKKGAAPIGSESLFWHAETNKGHDTPCHENFAPSN